MTEQRAAYEALNAMPEPAYEDIRLPDGTLVCRIDFEVGMLERQEKGRKYYIDLREVRRRSLDKRK